MGQINTAKMGVNGLLVMPKDIRKMLGVEKGSTVAWVITDDERIEVRTVKDTTPDEPNEFDLALKELGMSYEDWRASRKKFAKKWMKERYNIDVDTLPHAKTLS